MRFRISKIYVFELYSVDIMEADQHIELAVTRWAAWAPGLTDHAAWHSWAEGAESVSEPDAPDVKFVAPLMRRRLSRLSRMAFRAAADCLTDECEPTAFVFCSRYGEYHRSFGILENLVKEEPASAAAFSMTVHNTSVSLFAIEKQSTVQSTAIAGGETTLESAFLEAWSLLTSNAGAPVLVVYHDEPLPNLYQGQDTTVATSAAFAMLLQLPNTAPNATHLQLAWNSANPEKDQAKTPMDPALLVLRLLLQSGEPVVLATDRLEWTWSTNA